MINKKYKIFILISLLIPILILTIKNFEIKKNHTTVQNEINKVSLRLTEENENTFKNINIIFFIDFEDFTCFQCENQVIYLCKWIEGNKDSVINNKVLLFVKKRNNNEQYYKFLIGNWIKENKLNFQIKLDGSNIFKKLGVSKTSIAILTGNDNNLEYYNNFPLPRTQLEEIKKIIKSLFVTKT